MAEVADEPNEYLSTIKVYFCAVKVHPGLK